MLNNICLRTYWIFMCVYIVPYRHVLLNYKTMKLCDYLKRNLE